MAESGTNLPNFFINRYKKDLMNNINFVYPISIKFEHYKIEKRSREKYLHGNLLSLFICTLIEKYSRKQSNMGRLRTVFLP